MYLTSAQIKGKINSLAKQKESDPIGLLRIYMMERFLENYQLVNTKTILSSKVAFLLHQWLVFQ